jgi:hypothetical protein
LREEIPRVLRREWRLRARIGLRWIMISIVNDPCHRVSCLASSVLRLDRVGAVRLRLRLKLLATVVRNELVTNLAAHLNVEHRVAGAVLTIVCHGLSSASAAAQLSAGDDSHGTDHVGSRAGERVRHGATIAEASGEAKVGVDAEVGLDGLEHLVEESHIFAILVCPASVQTIGNDEDRRIVRNRLKAVVRKHTTTSDVLAVDDFLRTGAALVPGEHETVWVVLVVVVRDVEDVVAVLPVNLHGVLLVRERLGFATAGGVRCEDGRHCGQEEAQGREETVHVGLIDGADMLEKMYCFKCNGLLFDIYHGEDFGASLLADAFVLELPSYPRLVMKFSGIHSPKTSHRSF